MMRLAFDLDDTLCTRSTEEGGIKKYDQCIPIPEKIALVNECYEKGYHIAIFTARGMFSLAGDIDAINTQIRPMTEKQLKNWGVKYHELILGKYPYSLLVCDRVENVRNINSLKDIEEKLEIANAGL